MNRNTATAYRGVKRAIASGNATLITCFNKNHEGVGSSYLYGILYKSFAPTNTAAIRFIRLPLDNKRYRLAKRSTDILVSVVVITCILSWLIPLMAVLIKSTSPGPVFFLQKRSKRNGATFTCIKFRSMIVNSNADILPAAVNDARVTRLGAIMRKTFIDELPQFFNVLWGHMSVIGPRPHMLSENLRFEKTIPYYNYREKIKPGVTGLSQIMGLEGAADTLQKMKNRVDMDIFYLRHWSFKLDLIILCRTMSKIAGL
jgi:putative colanic acid biosysnthesis UDP-glucose lipid carrier transferase